jgi:hypothetical protein
MLHFNVDGDDDLDETSADRIELLTHRCFVRTDRPRTDFEPWNDRYSIPDRP